MEVGWGAAYVTRSGGRRKCGEIVIGAVVGGVAAGCGKGNRRGVTAARVVVVVTLVAAVAVVACDRHGGKLACKRAKG